jgi:hypothetical protein
MGLFSGRVVGEAVTYLGDAPNFVEMVDRSHGVRVSRGDTGVVLARHDRLFSVPTYDVAFGNKVVNNIPANELATDRWGAAFPSLANRPAGPSSLPVGVLDPLGDAFVGCMITVIALILVVTAITASLAWLGSMAWTSVYGGMPPITQAARAFAGIGTLLWLLAVLSLGHGFVFPRRSTLMVGTVSSVLAWLCWYRGAAPGEYARPIAEMATVGVAVTVVIVVNLFRLRGEDLNPGWFWFPFAVVVTLITIIRIVQAPLPGWALFDDSIDHGPFGGTLITLILIIGMVTAWCVAATAALEAPAAPGVRQVLSVIELGIGVAVFGFTGWFSIRCAEEIVTVMLPWFGWSGEILMGLMVLWCGILMGGLLRWSACTLSSALRRKGCSENTLLWLHRSAWIVPITLTLIFRYIR